MRARVVSVLSVSRVGFTGLRRSLQGESREVERRVGEGAQHSWLFPTHVTYMPPSAWRKEKPPPGMIRKWRFLLMFLVGATGFEPATFATPLQRATKLRHAPMVPG